MSNVNLHELFTKINDILNNAVSKWVDNTAHILAYLFNSAYSQCHELCASQFPFLQSLKNSVHLSEACLYVHISWSLAWAQQQSSLRFLQSSTSMIGGKARPQKQPVPDSSGGLLARKPYFENRIECCQGNRKSLNHAFLSSADLRKKAIHGGWCHVCVELHNFIDIIFFMQDGTLP